MARKPAAHAAFLPPDYDLADAYAVRALVAGTADPEQQKRALNWIIQRAAGTYDEPFRPESARETDFALGRAFVGRQIVKLINMPGSVLDKMRQRDPGTPSEQS